MWRRDPHAGFGITIPTNVRSPFRCPGDWRTGALRTDYAPEASPSGGQVTRVPCLSSAAFCPFPTPSLGFLICTGRSRSCPGESQGLTRGDRGREVWQSAKRKGFPGTLGGGSPGGKDCTPSRAGGPCGRGGLLHHRGQGGAQSRTQEDTCSFFWPDSSNYEAKAGRGPHSGPHDPLRIPAFASGGSPLKDHRAVVPLRVLVSSGDRRHSLGDGKPDSQLQRAAGPHTAPTPTPAPPASAANHHTGGCGDRLDLRTQSPRTRRSESS